MLRRRLLAATLLLGAACGHNTLSPGGSNVAQPFQFSSAPIELSEDAYVQQRGYDVGIRSEVRFHAAGTFIPLVDVVYAPAEGTVVAVASGRIDFSAPTGDSFYLTGVVPTVVVGQHVAARQNVGTMQSKGRQGFSEIGLGLLSSAPRPGFLRPERLSRDAAYGLPALDYFSSSLKPALSAKLINQGDGELAADVAGTLQGLWFLEGTPVPNSDAAVRIADQLWFVPSGQAAGRLSVHFFQSPPDIGLTDGSVIPLSDPSPRTVTAASGLVTYHVNTLFPIPEGVPRLLLVQMIDASHVRAEAFVPSTPPPASFTSKARVFVR